jgi:hypothetical protein
MLAAAAVTLGSLFPQRVPFGGETLSVVILPLRRNSRRYGIAGEMAVSPAYGSLSIPQHETLRLSGHVELSVDLPRRVKEGDH